MSGSGLLLRKLVQCPYSAGWRRAPVERIGDARPFCSGPWLDGMKPQIEFCKVFAVTDNAHGKVELFKRKLLPVIE